MAKNTERKITETENTELEPKKKTSARTGRKKAESDKDKEDGANAEEPKKSTRGRKKKAETAVPDETEVIMKAMSDKKAKGICVLDLTSIGSAIADKFIICNADSSTQVLAIADNVEDEMIAKCGRKVLRSQGKENAFWIILDYSDIVIHIFKTEYREFYRLEDLWADAKRTDYEE